MRDFVNQQRKMVFHGVAHVLLLSVFCEISSGEFLKKNEKLPNELQMCYENFEVHKDKIIRTQDSLDMGAKYLNEMEFNTKEECSKYCCDTERCDVFIYEEKKPGSCYLFQCGPLHDFKCKFTSHGNYTSGVLTMPRNAIRLENEMRISKQENELKSLRKLGDSASQEYVYTESSEKVVPTHTPKLILTTPTTPKQACSRNQYECRSSGECIAIYNVCDGIPQCTDGSDEAADLVCPTEKPTIPPPIIIQGPPQPPPLPADIMKYPPVIDQRKSYPPFYPHAPEHNPKPWEISNLPHQVIPQQQNMLYPGQQIEVPQLHRTFGSPGYQWDYQPLYEQNKDPYGSVNSFREQSNANTYEQEQPHIFNHKGSSVIGENNIESSGYLDSKRPYPSHFSSSNRGTWQETQGQPSPTAAPNFPNKNNEIDASTKSTTPPCDTAVEQSENTVKSKEDNKEEKHTEKHKPYNKLVKQETEKSSPLKAEAPNHHPAPKEVKEHKSVIVVEEHVKEHEKNSMLGDRLRQMNYSEVLRPKGAVVSLALGLTATAITATLIACRLRVVRRRGRRGHGPYAHDADYLVNGMYL